ncbi:unnamed protein product [Vitrella brassicaformis CCMP3155]|uniref:Uncharacterized protein n=3 Tax=Vitrella brassicaformis TaxID=1169539 RepID=A0A0G4EC49_VITBC|nr:unnamed protein product [Vitrella brassicaformis CCMP3155]|eukprot:CEL92906.1 unnamed protein product [Vitrella brassicaformis CCMP3155]
MPGATLPSAVDRLHQCLNTLQKNVHPCPLDALPLDGIAKREGKLTDAHLQRLADALARSTTFHGFVDLSNNLVTDQGLVTFAASLLASPSSPLTGLSLCGNPVGDRGAQAVAQLLARHPSFTSIDFSRTCVGDDGTAALANAARLNGHVREFRAARVGHHGLQYILQMAQKLRSLTSLEFTPIDQVTTLRFRTSLEDGDFDVSDYVAPREAGEEEEPAAAAPQGGGDEEDEEGAAERRPKWPPEGIHADDDSVGEETAGGTVANGVDLTLTVQSLRLLDIRGDGHTLKLPIGPDSRKTAFTPAYEALLKQLVKSLEGHRKLTDVRCGVGEGEGEEGEGEGGVPDWLRNDLANVCHEHEAALRSDAAEHAKRHHRSPLKYAERVATELDKGKAPESKSVLPMRSYVDRSLNALLSDALFELQRHKSKGNEAVSDAKGELAFISLFMQRKINNTKRLFDTTQ